MIFSELIVQHHGPNVMLKMIKEHDRFILELESRFYFHLIQIPCRRNVSFGDIRDKLVKYGFNNILKGISS